MNLFDLLIVQPIFNVLMLIYGLLPGHDFGVALILFTVLIRLLMWPLIKKQLHQTKAMRQMQPELQRIKKQAKGNKQLEAQLMMELYRERGVSPLGPIGVLIIQLPIFLALYRVVSIVTTQRDHIGAYTYDPLEKIQAVGALVADPKKFNEMLFGFINLSEKALSNGSIYWPILLLAVVAAAFQYVQSKQVSPQPIEKTRLRDMLKQQASGAAVDQSEMSAALSSKMMLVLPLVTLFISVYLPGALVLYFATSSLVAVIQQYLVLHRDVDEMETIAESKPTTTTKTTTRGKSAASRAESAVEAEVVEATPSPSTPKSKRRKGKKRR